MAFTRETNYNNRYLPSKRFFEWRNLAGEVPQAAELNEIQSLAKDLVQRAGDSILQNGDVIEGMYVESGSVATGIQYYNGLSGKIWIDGVVHNVPGSAKDLPVPDTGWGFIGVYLQKDLIDSVTDPTLFDPAITDINGTALGLPGANRARLTPLWVAGSLPVSDFDDIRIKNIKVIPNSELTRSRLSVDVDTIQIISNDSIYNAKISFPPTYVGDTTVDEILIYSGEELSIIPGSTLNSSIKVSGANNNNLKAYLQLFLNGFQVIGSPTEVDIPNNSVVNLTATIPQNISVSNKYSIGLVIKATSGYINTQATIYLSDLHLLKPSETRKPKYKTFTTSAGSQYSNFMVGSGATIKHGNFTLGDITVSNTKTINDIVLPPAVNSLDRIIRDTEITEKLSNTFLQTYNLYIEDTLIRIYPVHITYNGSIVSSLPNREFSRLIDRVLSERIGKVVSSSIVEGLTVQRASNQTVTINPGNAFVNGRLFVGIDPVSDGAAKPIATSLSLPNSSNNQQIIIEPELVGFDRSGYTKSSEGYKLRSGIFVAITKARAVCLFKERITHKSSDQYSERPFIPDLTVPLGDLDVLSRPAINVFKVQNVATGKVYRRGWDWDTITRVNGSSEPVTVIGWHTYDAIPGEEPVGSDEPGNNATYDVYYSAEIDLTLPVNNSDVNKQIKYLSEGSDNVSFDVLTESGTLDNVSGTKLKLDAGQSLPATVEGPFLKISNVNITFTGSIVVYSYIVSPQNSYIVYFSGDVKNDGPDGAIGYRIIGGGQDSSGLPTEAAEVQVKDTLLREQKLPLARVTVPITDNSKIVNYGLKMISLAAQQSVNNRIEEILDLLPAVLSQNLLAGDATNDFTYTDSSTYASRRQLKTVKWKIDAVAFPILKDYKVEVEYSYHGENPDLRVGQYATLLPQYEPTLDGFLRGMIAVIKDPGNAVVKTLVINFVYDLDTLDIISSESQVI